jgi:prevent-host-death family protein
VTIQLVRRAELDGINLADAKARFSELVDRVAAGDTVDILRRGKAVARLTPAHNARKPVDLDLMRALTETLSAQSQPAADFVRGMRETDRY